MSKILVTQPSLPPLDEFIPMLESIWESKWLTNNGKYHQVFEKALAQYLDVPYVSLFSNGTTALITALQSLNISGEVITTPYSFVATTNSLWWNGIKPVFVDVDEKGNLDPNKVEAMISSETSAILPVHIYGQPCDVESLEQICKKYDLNLIYDAAHAFGVRFKNRSILNYGDLSILSFHATKLFNTIEGGAVISHDLKTKERIDYLKNFGFKDETTVVAPGINGKMNELQAAYGLLQLKFIDRELEKRRLLFSYYKTKINEIEGIQFLENVENVTYNHAYFPIFIEEKIYGKSRDELYFDLQKEGIYGRRYFYPLISNLPIYKRLDSNSTQYFPKAESLANKVICLPFYADLEYAVVDQIVEILAREEVLC